MRRSDEKIPVKISHCDICHELDYVTKIAYTNDVCHKESNFTKLDTEIKVLWLCDECKENFFRLKMKSKKVLNLASIILEKELKDKKCHEQNKTT